MVGGPRAAKNWATWHGGEMGGETASKPYSENVFPGMILA